MKNKYRILTRVYESLIYRILVSFFMMSTQKIKIGKMFESIADTSAQNIQPKEKMAEFHQSRLPLVLGMRSPVRRTA